MILPFILRYVRLISATLFFGLGVTILGAVILTSNCEGDQPPEPSLPFKPLVVSPLIIFPDPVVIGQPALVSNGVCNTSSRPQQITYDAVVLQALSPTDQPIGDSLILAPPGDVILGPGECEAEELFNDIVPDLPTGRHRLFIHIETTGPQAGQVQREDILSEPFDLVAP